MKKEVGRALGSLSIASSGTLIPEFLLAIASF
jgi:hypothetical protein